MYTTMREPRIKVGDRLSKLTVINIYPSQGTQGGWKVKCLCECGNVVDYYEADLVTNKRRGSCGGEAHAKDKRSLHPLKHIWRGMIARCHDPSNKDWDNYGGRGITVCLEWRLSPWSFYNYMPERPAGYTIDRIDNDKGYQPGNVRWATASEQVCNRRSTNKIAHEGVSYAPVQYWRKFISSTVEYKTFCYRLRAGYSLDEASKPSTIPRKNREQPIHQSH